MDDTETQQGATTMGEGEDGALRAAAVREQANVHDEISGEGSGAPDLEPAPTETRAIPVRDLPELASNEIEPGGEESTEVHRSYTNEELTQAITMLTETVITLNKRLIAVGNMVGEMNKNDVELARRHDELRLVVGRTNHAAALLLNANRRIVMPEESGGNGKGRSIAVKAKIP